MKDVLPYETPSKQPRRRHSTLPLLSLTLFVAAIACGGGVHMLMGSAVLAAAGATAGITSRYSDQAARHWLGWPPH